MSSASNIPLVKNWQIFLWFVIAIFTAGSLFAEFTSLKTELTMVHERLDNKVQLINRLEDRIISIEKQLE